MMQFRSSWDGEPRTPADMEELHPPTQCFCILMKRKPPALTQYVVELVQVVLPRKDWLVGQHLSQDAAHWPNVNGLWIALRHKRIQSNCVTSRLKKKPISHQLVPPVPSSWAWSLELCTNEWPHTPSRNQCGRVRDRLSVPDQSHRSEEETESKIKTSSSSN